MRRRVSRYDDISILARPVINAMQHQRRPAKDHPRRAFLVQASRHGRQCLRKIIVYMAFHHRSMAMG